MSGITALELGAKTCAVVRVSGRKHGSRVSAAEVLDQAAFPDSEAFTNALRQVRKKRKLPRRARAVVWGMPEGSSGKESSVAPLVAPLVAAGFRIERVVTPCDALAVLARLRTPRPNAATCWLAIDRDGVAVIAVRPGKLLYSHSFVWDSSVGAIGSQARLLQRYSLVAVLAPEVQRAMAAARQEDTPVEGIVTCGNLPDLRSLTMPLIEELDVEVETLDSLEGLVVERSFAGQIGDAAAAIRIACAAAVARGSRPSWPDRRSKDLRRYAALVAGLAVMFIVGWYVIARGSQPAPPARAPATPRQIPPAAPVHATPPATTTRTSQPSNAGTVAGSTSRSAAPSPGQSVQTAAAKTANVPSLPSVTPPAQPRLPPRVPAPTAAAPAKVVSAPLPTRRLTPVPPLPSSQSEAAQPSSPRAIGTPPVSSAPPQLTGVQPDATPPSHGLRERSLLPSAPRTRAQPLKDPLPHVTGILVSQDRRYATLDTGQVVTVGDVIGVRTVVAIDERSITLREPSGLEIQVRLRGQTNTPGSPLGHGEAAQLRVPGHRP